MQRERGSKIISWIWWVIRIRDFLYDLRRTLTGRFTIVMALFIILATVGLTYASASSGTSSAAPQATAYILPNVYSTNGSYEITDLAVNGYGVPVPNLAISSWVYLPGAFNNTTRTYDSGTFHYLNGTTDSGGFVSWPFSSSSTYFYYNYTYQYISGYSVGKTDGYFSDTSTGGNFYPGSTSASTYGSRNGTLFYVMKVSNKSSQSSNNVMVYYAAPQGATMPQVDAYYIVYNGSGQIITPTPSSPAGMIQFKSMGGANLYVFGIPLNSTASNKYVTIALFNGNDTVVGGTTGQFYTTVSTGEYLVSILNIPFEFLIPIIGIFSAYFYYGKDKASGVLESVITRPVTKGRILVSRYVGTSATFLISLVVALGLADLVLYLHTGSFIQRNYFISMLMGWTVMAIAFSGIMYLVAQFIKSQGAQLGIGIGLFILLVFMWNLVVTELLLLFHANMATTSGYLLEMELSAISPLFYPTMMLAYNSGVYPPSTLGFNIGSSYSAASLGINLVSVIAIGLVWVVVPAFISFMLARSRD